MYKADAEGLKYISDSGKQYSLLEGKTSTGITSDILFILDESEGNIVDFTCGAGFVFDGDKYFRDVVSDMIQRHEKIDIFSKQLAEEEDTEMIEGVTFSTERFLAKAYPEEGWDAESEAIVMYTDDGQHRIVGYMDDIKAAVENGLNDN